MRSTVRATTALQYLAGYAIHSPQAFARKYEVDGVLYTD